MFRHRDVLMELITMLNNVAQAADTSTAAYVGMSSKSGSGLRKVKIRIHSNYTPSLEP